jgi:hypothetical protein
MQRTLTRQERKAVRRHEQQVRQQQRWQLGDYSDGGATA